MHRFLSSIAVFFLLALFGCQTIQFERPHVLSEDDWPTDGRTEARSRAVQETVGVPLELVWEYGANAGFSSHSPLVLQDRVLVGNRKGEVHAVEIETGRGRGFKQMGESVEGSPLIHDGTLYVPVAWGKHMLVAFDLAKGTNRWRKRGVPFATALIGHRETIVGVDMEGTLRAFSTADGEEEWALELASYRSFKASPVRVSESSILVVDVKGVVYRVDLDQQEVEWTVDLGAPIYETPAVDGAHAALTTTRGHVVLLDTQDGSSSWSWTGPVHVRMGAPALGANMVVVGATDGKVRAIDRDSGEVLWFAAFDDVVSAAPLIAGGNVFVGTLGQELAALDPQTGEQTWRTEVEGRIKSAMAVADGGLLVLTEPKWVLYYKPVQSNRSQGVDATAGELP